MATILEFRPQSRASMLRDASCAAEIVFFPGVRYERWYDDEPPAEKAATQRRRDRIGSVDEPA